MKNRERNRLLVSVCAPVMLLSLAPATSLGALSNGTWTQTTSGGLWDDATTGNWSGGTVADGSGFTADFSTLNITVDNAVKLAQPRTIGNLIFGDTTPSNGWSIDNNGSASNILTLAGVTPTVTVNALSGSKIVTISAQVSGSSGLTKAGAGTLVLQSSSNNWIGGTSVTNGSLAIGTTASQAGLATGALGAGDVSLGTNANLIFGRSGTYNLNANTIVQAPSTTGGRVQVGGAATYSLSSNTPNTFGGNLQIQHSAVLVYTDETASAARPGAGPYSIPVAALGGNSLITAANTATLKILANGADDAVEQTLNVARGFQLSTGGQTLTLSVDRASGTGTNKIVAYTGSSTLNAAVPAAGTTTVNFQGGNGYNIAFSNANAIAIGGGASSGSLKLNPTTANALVNGNVINSGSASAVKTLVLDGTSAGNLIAGQVLDQALVSPTSTTALVKSNNSTWILQSASSYTGGTTVTGGTLLVTNTTGSATGAGAVNVSSGTLGGTGIITGPVNLAGTIAPGLSIGDLATGTLAINAGTLAAEINTQLLTADKLIVSGDLTIGAGSVLSLSDIAAVPQAVPFNTVLTLVEYSGTWNTGVFTGYADDQPFSFGSNQYVINYNDAGKVTLTAVPEPAMLGLVGLVALGLGSRRRMGAR